MSHHWLDLKDFPTLSAAGRSVTTRSLPEARSRSGPGLDTLPSRRLWEKQNPETLCGGIRPKSRLKSLTQKYGPSDSTWVRSRPTSGPGGGVSHRGCPRSPAGVPSLRSPCCRWDPPAGSRTDVQGSRGLTRDAVRREPAPGRLPSSPASSDAEPEQRPGVAGPWAGRKPSFLCEERSKPVRGLPAGAVRGSGDKGRLAIAAGFFLGWGGAGVGGDF